MRKLIKGYLNRRLIVDILIIFSFCDSISLSGLSCVSTIFRALAKQSAFCEDRLQKFSEPWRNIILTNGCFCLKQLWELEHPIKMTTTQFCEHAEILMNSPGRLKDAIQYFFLALERNPRLSQGIDDLLSKIVHCLEERPTSYTEAVLLYKKVIKIDELS